MSEVNTKIGLAPSDTFHHRLGNASIHLKFN